MPKIGTRRWDVSKLDNAKSLTGPCSHNLRLATNVGKVCYATASHSRSFFVLRRPFGPFRKVWDKEGVGKGNEGTVRG
jgi:hypothetical protein